MRVVSTLKRTFTRLGLTLAAALAGAVIGTAPASATPGCVAQSIASEHEAYGTAWGHDLIAYLAGHPEVLQEFGFENFGALASFAALQDHEACPDDL